MHDKPVQRFVQRHLARKPAIFLAANRSIQHEQFIVIGRSGAPCPAIVNDNMTGSARKKSAAFAHCAIDPRTFGHIADGVANVGGQAMPLSCGIHYCNLNRLRPAQLRNIFRTCPLRPCAHRRQRVVRGLW
jgi:hypothetical protein